MGLPIVRFVGQLTGVLSSVTPRPVELVSTIRHLAEGGRERRREGTHPLHGERSHFSPGRHQLVEKGHLYVFGVGLLLEVHLRILSGSYE